MTTPWQLLCETIQSEMGLAPGQVYLYNNKLRIPPDDRLYVCVGIETPRCYANNNRYQTVPDPANPGSTILQSVQGSWWSTVLSIDIYSKGPLARDQKELVIMALASAALQQAMELNAFRFASLPTAMVNLSELEGATIPYRFRTSVAVMYFVTKAPKTVDSYDTINGPQLTFEA